MTDKLRAAAKRARGMIESMQACLLMFDIKQVNADAVVADLRAALDEPAEQPEPDHAIAGVLLTAAAKSGDLGALSLAAQLAGCAPCPSCGYVHNHCRCAESSKAEAEQAQPVSLDSIYAAWHGAGVDIAGGDWERFSAMLPPIYTRAQQAAEPAALMLSELMRGLEIGPSAAWSPASLYAIGAAIAAQAKEAKAAPREPLTFEQAFKILETEFSEAGDDPLIMGEVQPGEVDVLMRAVGAIERAHGIGAKP